MNVQELAKTGESQNSNLGHQGTEARVQSWVDEDKQRMGFAEELGLGLKAIRPGGEVVAFIVPVSF